MLNTTRDYKGDQKAYCVALLLLCGGTTILAAEHSVEGVPADAALQTLLDAISVSLAARASILMRASNVAINSQRAKPFAVVLSCADSRVAPEHLFDQGLGDLFVIRVAGNIVDDHILGSIEYAVEHLGAKLIMVLGHQNSASASGCLRSQSSRTCQSLVDSIRTANPKQNHDVDVAVRANVKLVVKEILDDEPLREGIGLKVVGARYDFDSGKVEILK